MSLRTLPLRAATAAACLALGLAAAQAQAQAQAPMHHGGPPSAAPSSATAPTPSPSTTAFRAADAAMMRAMDVPYSGDPDVDFRTHMIPHHQGAIDMARVALAYATDPATKAAAQTIIDDQEREIAAMRAWLKARGR